MRRTTGIRWTIAVIAGAVLLTPPAKAVAGTTESGIAAPDVAIAALGCEGGAIHGYARVKGNVAGMPTTSYSSSTTYVDVRYNCTGGAVSVRRPSTGIYFVRFAGDPSALAIAQNNADGFGLESTNNDNVLTVAKVTDTLDGGASFRVEVQDVCGDCSAGADPQNGQFTIMLI